MLIIFMEFIYRILLLYPGEFSTMYHNVTLTLIPLSGFVKFDICYSKTQ